MFHASATGLARDADDRLIYDTASGDLSWDEDGSGDADAITFARLQSAPELTESDFIIV